MTTATIRLAKEFENLTKDPVENVIFEIKNDNILEWTFILFGPHGSPYEGGVYTGEIKFPSNFPFSPPVVRFTCKLFHPNVYPDGNICISILHEGIDEFGYEHDSLRWNPIQQVRTIFKSIIILLDDPNPDSAANMDAGLLFKNDKKAYYKKIREEQ